MVYADSIRCQENSYHVSGVDVFGQQHEAWDEELAKEEALGHCGAEVLEEQVQVLLGGAGQVGGGG